MPSFAPSELAVYTSLVRCGPSRVPLSLPSGRDPTCAFFMHFLHRKEVIQPQVPLRLPCYDFIPVTSLTLGPCLLAVGFRYRERIHGAVADAPLLAIPASCRRVAAYSPNWAQFSGFPPPRGFGPLCTGHCSTCAALGIRAILT